MALEAFIQTLTGDESVHDGEQSNVGIASSLFEGLELMLDLREGGGNERNEQEGRDKAILEHVAPYIVRGYNARLSAPQGLRRLPLCVS